MIDEKKLLGQIRKKHVPSLVATLAVTILIVASVIFAIMKRPNQNIFEMIFVVALITLIFGSAAFVSLYQYLNPQKDIFFRKYGSPSEAVTLINAALSESKIYSNEKITITENYIYNPSDFTTLLKIDDVLLAYEQYIKDNKNEYACVGLLDAWGIQLLYKFKVSEVETVRKTIAAIRENFPNIRIGNDESSILYAQSRIKKLS